ncbi:MAG: transcriptional regulator GutM [Nitrososphaeria archaeon]
MVLIVGWLIRIPLNRLQVKNLQETFSLLGKEGSLITGAQKNILKGSCIVAIAVDNEGIVKKVMYLKGYTVFARFKEYNDFDGMTMQEVLLSCPETSNNPLYRAIRKALLAALKQKG